MALLVQKLDGEKNCQNLFPIMYIKTKKQTNKKVEGGIKLEGEGVKSFIEVPRFQALG